MASRSANSSLRASESSGRAPSSGSRGSVMNGRSSSATGSISPTKKLYGVPRVSQRLDPKTIDSFGSSKHKSDFGRLYSNGAVPCRLIHGSVKHKLQWESAPEDLLFDPILIYLSQGLVETVHPHAFIARQGFRELLETADSSDKVIPILSKIVPHLRAALGHKESVVFESAMDSIMMLSSVSGKHLNPHLKVLLVPIAKRGMDRKYRDQVQDVMMHLEKNGGKDALQQIKLRVPTYCSVFM